MRGNEEIAHYLSFINEIPEGENVRVIKSSYFALLEEARNITGRDNMGKIEDPIMAGNWLGAVAYLITIDHIGGKFAITDSGRNLRIRMIKEKLNGKNYDFINALVYFTDLNEKEIFSLYALRCALVHEYGLQNQSKNDNFNYTFSVTKGVGSLSIIEEIGNIKKATINLQELGNLVEQMHTHLIDLNLKNLLQVKDRLEFITFLKDM